MIVLFVGGIYGVGKSALCSRIGSALGVKHLTASDLIKYSPAPDDPTGKAVDDLRANQERLVHVLRTVVAEGEKVLLNGHFTLLQREGRISPVPIETFRAIAPSAMLLVVGKPEEIRRRLVEREGRDFDLELIKALDHAERQHAEQVSQRLRLPLRIFDNRASLEDAIRFFGQASQIR